MSWRMFKQYSCEGCGYFCALPLGKVLAVHKPGQMLMNFVDNV
jgi:hypothetical protein